MAKKEGKRRSVAQQMGEIFRQWQAALDSDDLQRAVEEMIAEYEKMRPEAFNAQLAREASRERLSAIRSAESERAHRRQPGSKPRAPRK